MATKAWKELSPWQEHPEAVAAGVCAVLVLGGWWVLHQGWLGLGLMCLSAAYVVGGYNSARDGLKTLLQERELDVDLLMIVAALGAAGLGLWSHDYSMVMDGGILILIFATSGALEGYAMQRTERSIQGLMSLTPDVARVLVAGQEQTWPIAQLAIGDQVVVKPGELLPVDGIVIEGQSAVNESSITGESMPMDKHPGDQVFAGTINGYGLLRVEVHQPPESSLIKRIIRLVEQAQQEAPPVQQFVERFERVYARVIVVAGVLLAVLPPFLWHWTWQTTIYRALVFLVAASPCALMASVMPVLLSGIANGAHQGILFKNGAQLQTMGQVRAIAFDKTGTLTTGKPLVVGLTATGGTPENLLRVAAALESGSEHPLGTAIVQAAQAQNLTWDPPQAVQACPGQGVKGQVEQVWARAGKQAFVCEALPDWSREFLIQAQAWEAQGKTAVWVSYGPQLLGVIAVADMVRPEAAEMVSHLQHLGLEEVVLLTGDNRRTADYVAQAVGISRVYAELLPEDKVKLVRQLQHQYQTVAMVGDGINDAPALALASVGIAMGQGGSDVALESADVVLMADRLEKLAVAVRLGRRSLRVIKQNIAVALAFIGLLLIANFTQGISLPWAVVGHEGSTVLVTLSGLRLLRP